MQILEIIGLFTGLVLVVALSLVVLLRSAEALSWRRERHEPPAGALPVVRATPAAPVTPRTPAGRPATAG